MRFVIASTLLLAGGLAFGLIGYALNLKKSHSTFSLNPANLKSWWQEMWGANALQGQFAMLYLGMSIMILDMVMGNKVNFDQFKTFSQVLIILPLILPAAGIDTQSEGMAKWILTFGTSFVFGGYPAFAIGAKLGLCDPKDGIGSVYVMCIVFMVIAMYWSFFHVGHLSRFYLFFEYNVFKDPSTPPAVHTLMLSLIYESNPSLVRQMLRSIHQRDMDGLLGPNWCTGEVSEDSPWAQMTATVMTHTEGWRPSRRGLKLLFIEKAHLELMKWAIDILKLVDDHHYKDIVPDDYREPMKTVLTSAQQHTNQ